MYGREDLLLLGSPAASRDFCASRRILVLYKVYFALFLRVNGNFLPETLNGHANDAILARLLQ